MFTIEDIRTEEYEGCRLFDIPGIFIDDRVDLTGLPESDLSKLFIYELRSGDEYDLPCQVKNFVWVNFCGTVITKQKISIGDGKEIHWTNPDSLEADSDDFYRTGITYTLQEFIEGKEEEEA